MRLGGGVGEVEPVFAKQLWDTNAAAAGLLAQLIPCQTK
jgi:hypothetical protein